MVIYNRDFYAGVSEGSASVLEDLVLEPLPQQRDAVLAPHGGGEAEQLMGQIVGGEVPPDPARRAGRSPSGCAGSPAAWGHRSAGSVSGVSTPEAACTTVPPGTSFSSASWSAWAMSDTCT